MKILTKEFWLQSDKQKHFLASAGITLVVASIATIFTSFITVNIIAIQTFVSSDDSSTWYDSYIPTEDEYLAALPSYGDYL